MSSRKRRKETKKIRDSHPTKTLKELEDEGLQFRTHKISPLPSNNFWWVRGLFKLPSPSNTYIKRMGIGVGK